MQLVWLNILPLRPQCRWRPVCDSASCGILQSGCSWIQLMGHMSLRGGTLIRYCRDLAAGLVPKQTNKQRNKKHIILPLGIQSVCCWFGLLIFKEIHLLIDWWLLWNKAADRFTQGLINIYVSFCCFLFGYVSVRTLEHPSQRFNQEENFTVAHRDSIKLFISRRAKLLRTVS